MASDGHIPEAYIASESQKITMYKRIASLRSLDDVEEMKAELRDRFGETPAPVLRLLDIMRVRALAGEAGVRKMSAGKTGILIEFDSRSALDDALVHRLRERFGKRIAIAWKDRPVVTRALDDGEDAVAMAREVISILVDE